MIRGDFNRETRNDAASYLALITKFDFLVVLVITTKALKYMQHLASKLQGKSVDIVAGYEMVTNVKDTFKDVRLCAIHISVYTLKIN